MYCGHKAIYASCDANSISGCGGLCRKTGNMRELGDCPPEAENARQLIAQELQEVKVAHAKLQEASGEEQRSMGNIGKLEKRNGHQLRILPGNPDWEKSPKTHHLMEQDELPRTRASYSSRGERPRWDAHRAGASGGRVFRSKTEGQLHP